MKTTAAVLGLVLVVAGPAAAQMVGYSIDNGTGVVSTLFCDENDDPGCFSSRTDLGEIDGLNPYATGLAPTGELVVWDDVNRELVWVDLPSLDIGSRLAIDPQVPSVSDVAFGPDGVLWLATHGPSLFIVDQTTGEATLIRDSGGDVEFIAFVGNRLFASASTRLLEIDPATGDEREVANYYWPGPYGGAVMYPSQLTAYDGRLFSLDSTPMSPPAPMAIVTLNMYDIDSGDYEAVAIFNHSNNPNDFYFTLDLVGAPEQQPGAIPAAGWPGLAVIAVLIGLAGVLVVRRVF